MVLPHPVPEQEITLDPLGAVHFRMPTFKDNLDCTCQCAEDEPTAWLGVWQMDHLFDWRRRQ